MQPQTFFLQELASPVTERRRSPKPNDDFLLPGLSNVTANVACDKTCDLCCKRSSESRRNVKVLSERRHSFRRSPELRHRIKSSPEMRHRVKTSPEMRHRVRVSPESRRSVKMLSTPSSQRRRHDDSDADCDVEEGSRCPCSSEHRAVERRRVPRRRRSSFVKSAHFPGLFFFHDYGSDPVQESHSKYWVRIVFLFSLS